MEGGISTPVDLTPVNPLEGFLECDAVAFQERVDRMGASVAFKVDYSFDPPIAAYLDVSHGRGNEVMIACRRDGRWFLKKD